MLIARLLIGMCAVSSIVHRAMTARLRSTEQGKLPQAGRFQKHA